MYIEQVQSADSKIIKIQHNHAMSRITSYLNRVRSYAKSHPKRTAAIGVAVVAVVLLVLSGNNGEAPTSEEQRIPPVEVATVAALSQTTDSLILLGEVRSVSQAELRVARPGEVTRVNVTSGQYVFAGTVLAEIDNAAERASVLSAQGSLAAAEASLAKTEAGARSEDRTSATAQTQSATISLFAAQESARSAYSQGYSLAQDAVLAQADDFFTNAYTVNPSFRVRTASFEERQEIEAQRVAIGNILETWQERAQTPIPDAQLDARLAEALADLATIKAFLNGVSAYVSEQELEAGLDATTKAAQEATLLGARSSVDTARSAVAGARTGLATAANAQTAASQSESKIVVGARSEDLDAAQAAVTQARGAYAGALAQLENTLVRTPISGIVTSLTAARGDYLTGQEVAAVVANPGALEIEAFVSSASLERITVDTPVLIDGRYEGVVTSVAPGLDPTTKRARVTVGLPENTALTNGSFVEVAVQPIASTEEAVEMPDEFRIPISAIKVLPRGLAVFTVSEDNMLVAIPITEGPIVGATMLVREGVTPELRIVTDVRGLAEGDQVTPEVPTND
jgi:multidrug efflux pump subunit AcrA (membrane-fusion protein)